MAKTKKRKRRQSHGSTWHWKQTDCWYYTEPGTKKRIALFDERGNEFAAWIIGKRREIPLRGFDWQVNFLHPVRHNPASGPSPGFAKFIWPTCIARQLPVGLNKFRE